MPRRHRRGHRHGWGHGRFGGGAHGHGHGHGGHGGYGGYEVDLGWLFEPGRFRFDRRPGCYNYGHLGPDSEEDEAPTGGPAGIDQAQPRPDQEHRDVLQVDKVDFMVADNVKQHHTDEYDICEGPTPQLVVRRGQQFTIRMHFTRPYDSTKDDLRLVFEIGEEPKASKGTLVEFVLSDKDEKNQWGAKISQQSGKSLTMTVFTPPDCIVGKWHFKLHVVKKANNKTAVFRYNHKDPIYLLFNPWCREDTVYLEKADDLEAYVLKEDGKIFSGNSKRISPKPWIFGQFQGKVLDCCMYLLKESGLNYKARGNPIKVVRKLTAMVNSQDEDGVLTGNWSGNYSGGKSPLTWAGSVAILEQYYKEKRPVRFGQCWVFSGVLTTVCRALGLPARSVTNFASAHDVDTTITIDLHFDSSGEPKDDLDEDSIWNFHVWNEVWMARPDLPAGFGGWQACDATPQETSDGVYCCGPCPLRAIKEGEVQLAYDGPFIFAEVNADRVYWLMQEDGSWKNVYMEKNVVGKFISTLSKQPRDERTWREDITHLYKYPEGSPEERVAVQKANKMGSTKKDVYQTGPQDVKFEMCFDTENTFVGSPFVLELQCKNTSKEKRTLQGQCNVKTMFYTGVTGELVGREPFNEVVLQPGETKTVAMKLEQDAYHCKLKDCCMLSLSAMARVKETSQIFTKRDDTRLRKPHLSIKAPATTKKEKEINVEVSFTNPLGKTLTGCYLEVEGPGLEGHKTYPQGDVQGKGTFLTTLKLKPKKKGEKEIVVIFNSKELEDINGSHAITIQA